ncbi:unnamed protein product, partial [Staurois parvus]
TCATLQCHLPVPSSAPSAHLCPPTCAHSTTSATHQCSPAVLPSVPSSDASQCRLSVPIISVTYQCRLSVLHISAAYPCHLISVLPISAL